MLTPVPIHFSKPARVITLSASLKSQRHQIAALPLQINHAGNDEAVQALERIVDNSAPPVAMPTARLSPVDHCEALAQWHLHCLRIMGCREQNQPPGLLARLAPDDRGHRGNTYI